MSWAAPEDQRNHALALSAAWETGMPANRFSYQTVQRFVEGIAALTDQYGVRGLERRIGVNKATISRVQNGKEFDLATAQALGGVVGVCPCCGQDIVREQRAA